MTVREAAERYRQALIRHDQAAARAITSAWRGQLGGLHRQLQRLIRELEHNPELAYPAIRRLASYQVLDGEITRAMNQVGVISAEATIRGQTLAIDTSLTAAQRLTMLQGEEGWTPIERLAAVSLADTAETIQLLRAVWQVGADEAKRTLAGAIISRQSPRRVAVLLNKAVGTPLPKALTISRTEILRASREAARQSFIENRHLLTGWTWLSAMDDRTCPYCWSQTGTHHPVTDELVSHPNCFPNGTLVAGPAPVGSTSRWYDGDLVKLRLASGGFLSCTPNHPMLTPEGWVAAGLLHEGEDVVRCLDPERPLTGVNPHDHHVPALIEEVAVTVAGAGAVTAARVPTAAEDFHGDGIGSEIHVVRSHRLLRDGCYAAVAEPFAELGLCCAHAVLAVLAGGRAAAQALPRIGVAPSRFVGGEGVGAALLDRPRGGHEAVGVDAPADGSARFGEYAPDRRAADSEGFAQRLLALTGEVAADKVVAVERESFHGWVSNLETRQGWYIANQYITHNCRCVMVPDTGRLQMPQGPQVFSGLSAVRQKGILGPKAYAAYKNGTITLADLAGTRVDARWGEVGYTRSVAAATAAPTA